MSTINYGSKGRTSNRGRQSGANSSHTSRFVVTLSGDLSHMKFCLNILSDVVMCNDNFFHHQHKLHNRQVVALG